MMGQGGLPCVVGRNATGCLWGVDGAEQPTSVAPRRCEESERAAIEARCRRTPLEIPRCTARNGRRARTCRRSTSCVFTDLKAVAGAARTFAGSHVCTDLRTQLHVASSSMNMSARIKKGSGLAVIAGAHCWSGRCRRAGCRRRTRWRPGRGAARPRRWPAARASPPPCAAASLASSCCSRTGTPARPRLSRVRLGDTTRGRGLGCVGVRSTGKVRNWRDSSISDDCEQTTL